jgi:hypothetical protein
MAKISFPGYFIEKPAFQATKNLRRLLSEQDSCFPANQLSIFFLEDYIKRNQLDNVAFIRELCQKFHVSGAKDSGISLKN